MRNIRGSLRNKIKGVLVLEETLLRGEFNLPRALAVMFDELRRGGMSGCMEMNIPNQTKRLPAPNVSTKVSEYGIVWTPLDPLVCPISCSFLLLNSVALHGDGCPICQAVETELIRLSRELNCSLQVRKTRCRRGGR